MGLQIPENMRFQGVGSFQLPDLENAEPVLSDFQKWKLKRLGRITGSQFHNVKIMSRGKNKGLANPEYINSLIAELMTGLPQDQARGAAIDWGNMYESEAIKAYEELKGVKIKKAPFRLLKNSSLIGCTADGLVNNDGVIEAKCPYNSKNHVEVIINKAVPTQYKDQVNGHLLCTGRKWYDFISYDPRNKVQKIIVLRVERDANVLTELYNRLKAFETEYQARMKKLGIRRNVKIKRVKV